ncbi:hypothetical protein KXS07_18580 [Inquilinus limosus]|uniref:hypothetical protein n=1 Tax=Inquilinus limosus TaxID=171674 RepID=UPI003F153C82
MKGKQDKIEITRDAQGRPRVVPGTAAPMLADFLETDLRGDADWTAGVAARLAEAGEGEEPITGNLYALEIRGDRSVLRNIHDAKVPALTLPTGELAAAVDAWRKALRKPGRTPRPRRKG